jgi:carbohydrate kinase (thermoresistant glucokinase family)
MGVSGSGKSTVGKALAGALGCTYFDADTFHSAEAIAKMQSGTPLDDHDRMPWLGRIAQKMEELLADGESGVIGCSALKRGYRDLLLGQVGDPAGLRALVPLVYLKGSFDLIRNRLAARQGHFMPPSLLQSQFDQLEEPAPEEQPIAIDIAPAPDAIVAAILDALADRGSLAQGAA